MNAIMGVARPGDMGFDCIHTNLHKTFSTPHGGGGPGACGVGCKEFLAKFLPGPVVEKKGDAYVWTTPEKSIGKVSMFYGNFDVVVRGVAYMLSMGREGIREAAQNAVLNANYMKAKLAAGSFEMAYDGLCMHEFVIDASNIHDATGCSALDIAKRMLDYDLHPPTMYFPLIVHEALMVEPTETESKETLDEVCAIYEKIAAEAREDAAILHEAPHTTPVRRLDEVAAARNMVLRYRAE